MEGYEGTWDVCVVTHFANGGRSETKVVRTYRSEEKAIACSMGVVQGFIELLGPERRRENGDRLLSFTMPHDSEAFAAAYDRLHPEEAATCEKEETV